MSVLFFFLLAVSLRTCFYIMVCGVICAPFGQAVFGMYAGLAYSGLKTAWDLLSAYTDVNR